MSPTFLRLGSRGDQVKSLQSALNLWDVSAHPQLSTDGAFGPKTDHAVRRHQIDSNLSADGIVGPNTWDSLGPFIQSQISTIFYEGEEYALESVFKVAKSALETHGWKGLHPGAKIEDRPTNSLQIAAAFPAGPEIAPGKHQRIGGASLQKIFQIAGAAQAPQCTHITREAAQHWQDHASLFQPERKARTEPPPAVTYQREINPQKSRVWLNNHDLPAWCGIFCFYVYKTAGLNLGGWANFPKTTPRIKGHEIETPPNSPFIAEFDPQKAQRGWIGIQPRPHNHHFIFDEVRGSIIHSIDGNLMAPNGAKNLGYLSVIGEGKRTLSDFKSYGGYFLRPNLENILKHYTFPELVG